MRQGFIGLYKTCLELDWGDLNPRPKLLYLQYYTFSLVFNFAYPQRTDTQRIN